MRYTIGLREAHRHLAKHIRAVEEGHEVIMTRRGQPVARLAAEFGAGKIRMQNGWLRTSACCS